MLTTILMSLLIFETIIILIMIGSIFRAGRGIILIDNTDPDDIKISMNLTDDIEERNMFVIKVKHKDSRDN